MDVFKVFAATVPFLLVFAKDGPQFLGPGSNVTVVEGRDATFTCRMENLHHYKVAWLRVDTQTILTIGPHVITKNYRVAVTRVDPQSWTLTLRETRPADEGQYMCQINTEPMITQTHHLQVVVPPDIVDVRSSGEVLAREGDNVTLHCEPTGNPAPTVTWRREDGAGFRVAGRAVNKWSGTWLNMSDVTREQDGAFLCIATNGVPPSVSRRVLLRILCAPSVWAVHNMVGGYSGAAVHLQCAAEASPAPAVYWTHVDLSRLQDGSKYTATVQSEGYRHSASLLVSHLSRDDVGTYHCHVENSLGKARAGITLYTLATTTTDSTTTAETSTTTLYEVEELEPTPSTHVLDTNIEKEFDNDKGDKSPSDQDNFVAVLSQHQMQNLDISPSS